jgi:rRNA maturation endonuclease Nob1
MWHSKDGEMKNIKIQPIKVLIHDKDYNVIHCIFVCGSCMNKIENYWNFCPICGNEIKQQEEEIINGLDLQRN